MAHEIDFIGSDKTEKDYDAIGFRYKTPSGRFIKCIYDGGTSEVGKDVVAHVEEYYFSDAERKVDMVFCSHPDLDHAAGLREVLSSVKVDYLVMNRPWDYVDELFDRVKDGRITKESLERTLREKYKFVDDLEKLAVEKGVRILPGIVGTRLYQGMNILSPTKEFYIERLVDSAKTPAMESNKSGVGACVNALRKIGDSIASLVKSIWSQEELREGEKTSAENEMSIVLRVEVDERPFLLVGDAGCMALTQSIALAKSLCKPLTDCSFYQIPHHGGKHNVSPSVMNGMVGPILSPNSALTKTAYVSAAKGSSHPRRVVTNSFIKRGCSTIICRDLTKRHHFGDMPERVNYIPSKEEGYSPLVEPWA